VAPQVRFSVLTRGVGVSIGGATIIGGSFDPDTDTGKQFVTFEGGSLYPFSRGLLLINLQIVGGLQFLSITHTPFFLVNHSLNL